MNVAVDGLNKSFQQELTARLAKGSLPQPKSKVQEESGKIVHMTRPSISTQRRAPTIVFKKNDVVALDKQHQISASVEKRVDTVPLSENVRVVNTRPSQNNCFRNTVAVFAVLAATAACYWARYMV